MKGLQMEMEFFASVRCRCLEEGKLNPGPVPSDDLFVNRQGHLASRKLDGAHSKSSYRQFKARYGELNDAFEEWREHACRHGCCDRCFEWFVEDDVAQFRSDCARVGEGWLPNLCAIFSGEYGLGLPAEKAAAALEELDALDGELSEREGRRPVDVLVNAATGLEAWCPEFTDPDIFVKGPAKMQVSNGEFRIIRNDGERRRHPSARPEVLLSSRHFRCELISDPDLAGDEEPWFYRLVCLDSGKAVECYGGFEFRENPRTELIVGSRSASCSWPSSALRKLLVASLETGNPIRLR